MNPKIKVAPSLLSADFARLKEEIAAVEKGRCDMLHIDVMDGHFVPNITVGPFIVRAIRAITRLPLDVHLMIEQPWNFIPQFAEAGADHITVHEEACRGRLPEVLKLIQDRGCTRGVSVKPATPVDVLLPHLDSVEMVLIMTVNPGFGGQAFMADMMPKIAQLRSKYTKDIEVDGGITPQTAKTVVKQGANVLVAGTAIFNDPEPARVIRELRNSRGL